MRSDATRIITLLLFATALLLLFQYRERLDIEMLNQWLVGKGWKAPVFFILAYATATVFFLPGTVMTLAGGALFGPFWGTLYNLSGATLGAGLAFLVARYLAGDTIRMRLRGRTGRLLQGVEEEGWRFVAFARLVPLFPFNLLNYALGLTHISFT
ncbi:MAG: TVP38/TMEM64 family protein, partial [Chromatiales bacterium]